MIVVHWVEDWRDIRTTHSVCGIRIRRADSPIGWNTVSGGFIKYVNCKKCMKHPVYNLQLLEWTDL